MSLCTFYSILYHAFTKTVISLVLEHGLYICSNSDKERTVRKLSSLSSFHRLWIQLLYLLFVIRPS